MPDKCQRVKWYNTINYYVIMGKKSSDVFSEKLLINTIFFFLPEFTDIKIFSSNNSGISKNEF